MMDKIGTESSLWDQDNFNNNHSIFDEIIEKHKIEKEKIKEGGGTISIEKQHAKKRLTARERIEHLIDINSKFFEIGIYAGWEMYKEYGSPPAAGVVAGIGEVENRFVMIIANDATVKAGAYFEISLKKTLRAQKIAIENKLPIIYLVDSAGVFLPLQEQVFPDEGHFGRIFYNNARISSMGIPQIALVMGPCVAGGAYLPVMCDKYIIVEGASMFLAGPALVKAAIGQEIDQDTLGGANTHSNISGTADYHEKDDIAALSRARNIIANINFKKYNYSKNDYKEPIYSINSLKGLFNPNTSGQYCTYELLARIIDASEFNEYKKNYGKTIICGTCKIGGYSTGIVASQRLVGKSELGEMQMGGVIYSDSADKAARFIMNCNQDNIPIIFIHDVNGFMIGKNAEWGGIAKDGAKLVNAVSNSVVPKITLVVGGSYGAGNYALSGRAYSPRFMFAWPSAKIAVMGGEQAAKTLTQIKLSKISNPSEEIKQELYNKMKKIYDVQSDPRYAAARLWVDEIIEPVETRDVLIKTLFITYQTIKYTNAHYGVLQV